MISQEFWNSIKPFFPNKGVIKNENIALMENGFLKNEENEMTEMSNRLYKIMLVSLLRHHFLQV